MYINDLKLANNDRDEKTKCDFSKNIVLSSITHLLASLICFPRLTCVN